MIHIKQDGAGSGWAEWASTAALTPIQRKTLEMMERSRQTYMFDTSGQLLFELKLREAIVQAATSLYLSRAGFAVFTRTRSNPQYWEQAQNGLFRVKPGISPSDALTDIYTNGPAYAFECATAMLVVLYKAVLTVLGNIRFDRLFAGLYLYDWQFDQDLGVVTVQSTESLPGDIVYFENPDFDPEQPQWRGENAVDMGDGTYYGHGIGITGADGIIRALNGKRRSGATRSAYMLHQTTRPNYRYLAQFAGADSTAEISVPRTNPVQYLLADSPGAIIARIGRLVYRQHIQ